jgi:signal transduction histidine kinase
MEGFRVLPYGGPGDDWLDLDRDYARRTRELEIPAELGAGDPDENEYFKILSNLGYYGAVFLTLDGSPGLEMVVSREGFIPNDSFWTLRSIVRSAIDLSTRVRAAASSEAAEDKIRDQVTEPKESANKPGAATGPSERRNHAELVVSQLNQARAALARLRDPGGASPPAAMDDLDAAIAAASDGIDALLSTQSTLRILASVGQQLAEFVHETNGMLALARQVTSLLRPSAGQPGSGAIRAATDSADQLVRLIDRQASYLVEVLSPDSRRRRSRRQLARSVHAAAQLVASRTEHRGITVTVDVPNTLETIPIFGAELTTVFTNLLTNAVKAAGSPGKIQVVGVAEGATTNVTVENTGVAVDLEAAEQWFRPFESTTSAIDPVLGQGMGLGLTIVRSTLDEYGGSVAFVEPSPGFATAVQVRIPKQKR